MGTFIKVVCDICRKEIVNTREGKFSVTHSGTGVRLKTDNGVEGKEWDLCHSCAGHLELMILDGAIEEFKKAIQLGQPAIGFKLNEIPR